jgi:hypothetical protein
VGGTVSAGLQPMTDQDLQDWGAVIDAKAQQDQARGVIRNGVINAGQAVTDLINARRGTS